MNRQIQGAMLEIYTLQKSVMAYLDKIISDDSVFLPFPLFFVHPFIHLSLTTASLRSCDSNVDTKELCGE